MTSKGCGLWAALSFILSLLKAKSKARLILNNRYCHTDTLSHEPTPSVRVSIEAELSLQYKNHCIWANEWTGDNRQRENLDWKLTFDV